MKGGTRWKFCRDREPAQNHWKPTRFFPGPAPLATPSPGRGRLNGITRRPGARPAPGRRRAYGLALPTAASSATTAASLPSC